MSWRDRCLRLSSGADLGDLGNPALVFMFFHWFEVKAINTSNLLFAIQSIEPEKSAWEALDFIPIDFYRVVDPLIFYVERTITDEGAAQPPIFLALLAATGIAFGGCVAMREEGFSRAPAFDSQGDPTIFVRAAEWLCELE